MTSRLRSVPMPSAASSIFAPGHRRRDGSRSALPNGPRANASPRARVAIRDASLMSPYRLSAAPFRFPLANSSPSIVTCTTMACGSISSAVTTHGPSASGSPSAVASGSPLAPCADQSFTNV